MKRRDFLSSLSLFAAASCARDGSRPTRYNEHACPFCTTKKGVCAYCRGTKKCSYCKGTGTRKVVIDDPSNDKIMKSTYEESCPFCSGKGVCRYCDGKGKCWACDGTGLIDSWDFYSKARQLDSGNGRGLK